MTTDFQNGTSLTTNLLGTMSSVQDQLALSVQSEWGFSNHYLVAGAEYTGDRVSVSNDAVYCCSYSGRAPVRGSAKASQQSLDVFAQDEWEILPDLKLTGGLRFSSIQGELESTSGTTFTGIAGRKDSDSHLVGSLGAVYRGIGNLALRALYSQGYRYPTVRQLYTGNSAHGGGSPTYPNPGLKPETSHNYEIGARYLDEAWDLDLALFYSESKNFIQILGTKYNNGIRSYINGDRAVTYGAELLLSRAFRSGETVVTPYAQGNYLKRKLTLNTGASAGRSTSAVRIPPLEGSFGIKLSTPFSSGSVFHADLRANMAVEAENLINDTIRGEDPFLDAEPEVFPAWQTLDLTLGLTGGEDLKYSVTLALRNLFNQAYFDARGDIALPEPGFHAVLAVGVRL
jgi:hemoglobin/transferrin/lactoferrin receptor protein